VARNDLLQSLGYYYNSWDEIYTDLQDLYMSVFKWEKLPEDCNERYIELSLLKRNQAVFYFQKDIQGYICVKSSIISKPNIYGEPVRVRAWGNNGFTEDIDIRREGVIIFDNKSRRVPLTRLKTFAKRIWNMEKTIDINIHQQKTPRIWKATRDTEYTVKTLLNRVNSYTEDVVVDDVLKEGANIDSVLSPAPFVSDKIRIEKNALWAEVMTFCGIESNSAEKKERVTPDEIEVSNGQAKHKLMSRYREREKAVKKINEKYGLDIELKLNIDFFEDNKLQQLMNRGEEVE